MPGKQGCTVFIGNLDEKVSERVLYEITVQAGPIVDLHIPRDKTANRPKGYAFVEYESEETANYAIKLFSGLVSLHNRTLRFAISGQDRISQSSSTHVKAVWNLSSNSGLHRNDTQHFQEQTRLLTPAAASRVLPAELHKKEQDR